MTVRLFLAVPIDAPARQAGAMLAADVASCLARWGAARAVKWVEQDNLHVTLRFLGEVDTSRVGGLQSALRSPLAVPCFSLVLAEAGCFPAAGLPRVLWVGVSQGSDQARAVFAELDARLAPLGFPREPRAYTPHLTLGRVRELSRDDGRRLRERLAEVPSPLATSWIDRVTLYRSHLTPRGPHYEVVQEVRLTGPVGTP
jgi:RNA 2',3'-cyclic 3'-phosphodiesterase